MKLTKDQAVRIKALVDVGGWDAVRADSVLWKALLKSREADRRHVDATIDLE